NICKNLFLRDAKGKNHFLMVMPAEKRADLVALAGKIDSTKLSFASAERLSKYLGVPQGSVSPFAVLNDSENDVTVVFDNDLKRTGIVGIHPNDNTASVWLPLTDLEEIIAEHGNKMVYVTL
ncbi:MAG: YbaK/EbsC family protein, partial [Oscillospiraceae bacterium]